MPVGFGTLLAGTNSGGVAVFEPVGKKLKYVPVPAKVDLEKWY